MNDNSNDEKIGYLRAQSEEQRSDLVRIEQKLDNLIAVVNRKFVAAEMLFKILKFAGVLIIAIVTFQFGDIKSWWTYLFK